jgi:hypothetical protein
MLQISYGSDEEEEGGIESEKGEGDDVKLFFCRKVSDHRPSWDGFLDFTL